MDLRGPSGIIAARSRAFARVPLHFAPVSHSENDQERTPLKLPAALAFLSAYNVDLVLLVSTAEEARRQAVAPEAALLAGGIIQERFFYRCLAHYLGVAFVEGEVMLGAGARYPYAIHSGIAPLDGRDGCRWLAAPRGQLLVELLVRAHRGERFSAGLAITTPSHMSRLLRAGATTTVLWEASHGLANLDPNLSAKAGASPAQCAFAMAATGVVSFAFGLMPGAALAFVSLTMTCFFLASIWLRLFAGAESTASVREPFRPVIEDRWLPVYSIVVALHREARVVPQLIAALDAIDYPGIMAQTPQEINQVRA